MDGYRVYRVVDPPADWRERLALASRILAAVAEGSAEPALTVQGRGFEALERTRSALGEAARVNLWGFLGAGAIPRVLAKAADILRLPAPIYLGCERFDAERRLHLGARAYVNPEPKNSSLMLTIPPFDPASAVTELAAFLDLAAASGLITAEGHDTTKLANALVHEPKVTAIGDAEARPMGSGDHPHMIRLASPRGTAEVLLPLLETVVAQRLRAVDQTYFRLLAPGSGANLARDLPFEGPPHWKLSAPLSSVGDVEPYRSSRYHVSVSYRGVRWPGHPESDYNEVVVGISSPAFLLHVDLRADTSAVESRLREGAVAMERLQDMPFE